MNFLKNAILLAIDDDEQILTLLSRILTDQCKEFIGHKTPEQGLKTALIKQPDLILLDVLISTVNGYDICKQLKTNPETAQIPVIFLSALIASQDKVKGFSVGGVDYISKPFDINEVIARIESCLVTHQKIRQQQHFYLERTAEILRHYHFSRRELEILQLYIAGHKRSDIAEKIYISENTVKWYLKKIFQKLDVSSRAALIEKMQKLAF